MTKKLCFEFSTVCYVQMDEGNKYFRKVQIPLGHEKKKSKEQHTFWKFDSQTFMLLTEKKFLA